MMHIFYRSRFQPQFGVPHAQAVAEFYNLKKNLNWEAALVLGIVDEQLFMSLLSEKFQEAIDAILRQALSNSFDAYLLRFDSLLNPSKVGEVKRSLWDRWYRKSPHPLPELRYTIMCCTAWTAISLYTTGMSIEAAEAADYVTRWLPERDPNNIGWYFPIFDNDDVNDMGLIASLLSDRFDGNFKRERDLIIFARFDYGSEFGKNLIYSGRYGAYVQLIATKTPRFGKAWENISSDLLRGLAIPRVTTIPFIYRWSDLIEIYQAIFGLVQDWRNNSGDLSPNQQAYLKEFEQSIYKEIDSVKQRRIPYIDNLQEFHGFMRQLPTYFQKGGLANWRAVEGLRALSESATSECASEGMWLESNVAAEGRLREMMRKINEIVIAMGLRKR